MIIYKFLDANNSTVLEINESAFECEGVAHIMLKDESTNEMVGFDVHESDIDEIIEVLKTIKAKNNE